MYFSVVKVQFLSSNLLFNHNQNIWYAATNQFCNVKEEKVFSEPQIKIKFPLKCCLRTLVWWFCDHGSWFTQNSRARTKFVMQQRKKKTHTNFRISIGNVKIQIFILFASYLAWLVWSIMQVVGVLFAAFLFHHGPALVCSYLLLAS